MTEQITESPLPEKPSAQDEISFLDLLLILAKRKQLITKIIVSAMIISAIISWLMPNIYTGKTVILPPQQSQASAAMVIGQLGALAGGAGTALGIKSPGEIYVSFLKSRTVADALIARFKLKELYGRKTLSSTRHTLEEKTSISLGKDGLISIGFDDKNPQRAANIANAYVEEMDKLTNSLAITEASQRRLFFGKQMVIAKDDLTQAEIALKKTQEKTGLISLDAQDKAIIESVAALRAQIAAKEVQLSAMQTYATKANPDYLRAKEELSGLKAQLAKIEHNNNLDAEDMSVPTDKMPEVGMEYIRKLRDVKFYDTLYELIAKQFEIAKIDESKDSAIIQVVDRAIPPDIKSKPNRLLIVLLFTALATLVAIAVAFIKEATERASVNPIQEERLRQLRRFLWGA